jgi:hypothetical protein
VHIKVNGGAEADNLYRFILLMLQSLQVLKTPHMNMLSREKLNTYYEGIIRIQTGS